MSDSTTRMSSVANACAMPSPMPLAAPVITATLPVRSSMGPIRGSSRSACQQHAAGNRATTVGHDGDIVFGDLSPARLASQLQARFVEHPVAVHPSGRQLAAVGVER